jgi:hypothetical protein
MRCTENCICISVKWISFPHAFSEILLTLLSFNFRLLKFRTCYKEADGTTNYTGPTECSRLLDLSRRDFSVKSKNTNLNPLLRLAAAFQSRYEISEKSLFMETRRPYLEKGKQISVEKTTPDSSTSPLESTTTNEGCHRPYSWTITTQYLIFLWWVV